MKRIALTLALLLPLTAALIAQPPGSLPARTGQATFTLGGTAFTYGKVDGFFMAAGGYTSVNVMFSSDGKPTSDRLGLSLMIQKPGPVDLNQPMGNGIDYRKGGTFFTYEKGKSQCTITVTKLTPTLVEGTAECPVLNEKGGGGQTSLTGLKFMATTASGG